MEVTERSLPVAINVSAHEVHESAHQPPPPMFTDKHVPHVHPERSRVILTVMTLMVTRDHGALPVGWGPSRVFSRHYLLVLPRAL